MNNKINRIADAYWNEEEEYYSAFRYEGEDEKEFSLIREIEQCFEENSIPCECESVEGVDYCSYSCDFHAFAWVEDGKPKLYCIKTECR